MRPGLDFGRAFAYVREMKRVTIDFDESLGSELERFEKEGKLFFLGKPQEVVMYTPKNVGTIDREHDIIWAKPPTTPIHELVGSISKETADEMVKRIDEGW